MHDAVIAFPVFGRGDGLVFFEHPAKVIQGLEAAAPGNFLQRADCVDKQLLHPLQAELAQIIRGGDAHCFAEQETEMAFADIDILGQIGHGQSFVQVCLHIGA
ncbi:hypothetical protein D3C81_1947740 [compost metagenome]